MSLILLCAGPPDRPRVGDPVQSTAVIRGIRLHKTVCFLEVTCHGPQLPGEQLSLAITEEGYDAADDAAAVTRLRHLLQIGDVIEFQGRREERPARGGRPTDTVPLTVRATSIGVTRLQLRPARILNLLADAQKERNGMGPELACDLLGLPPSLYPELTELLAQPLLRREQALRRLAAQNQDALAKQRLKQQPPHGAGKNFTAASEASRKMSRAQRLAKAVKTRQRSFYVVLERPYRLRNLAAILRTCDAFGVTQVLLIDTALDPNSDEMRSVSASASQWVDCICFESLQECTEYLDSLPGGVTSYGTTVHSNRCQVVYDVDFCRSAAAEADSATDSAAVAAGCVGGVALWFGNEAKGLTEAAEQYCPVHVFVPMLGVVESLNISVCVGIMCAEVARQRVAFQRAARAAGRDWDWALPPEAHEAVVQRLLARERKRRESADEAALAL